MYAGRTSASRVQNANRVYAAVSRLQPRTSAVTAVTSPPTSTIAPNTWSRSGKFQPSGRIAASTSRARLVDHDDEDQKDGDRGREVHRTSRPRSGGAPSARRSARRRGSPPRGVPRAAAPGRRSGRLAARGPFADRPEHERGDDPAVPGWYASMSIASQIPKMSVPTVPITIASSPASRSRSSAASRPAARRAARRSRASRSRERRDERGRAGEMEEEQPVREGHVGASLRHPGTGTIVTWTRAHATFAC